MDGDLFYFAGGALVLLALVFAAIGIRRHETFPPNRGVMLAVTGVFLVFVVASAATAVVLAREEQDHRRHELAEEQAHAQEEVDSNEQSPAENEAAPPGPVEAQKDVDIGVPPGRGSDTELDVTSPEDGSFVFEPDALTAPPGTVTLVYANPSQVPHSIAIEASGRVVDESETVTDATTEASGDLAPGEFVFFCTVPGHRDAGMEGTLTVQTQDG